MQISRETDFEIASYLACGQRSIATHVQNSFKCIISIDNSDHEVFVNAAADGDIESVNKCFQEKIDKITLGKALLLAAFSQHVNVV